MGLLFDNFENKFVVRGRTPFVIYNSPQQVSSAFSKVHLGLVNLPIPISRDNLLRRIQDFIEQFEWNCSAY